MTKIYQQCNDAILIILKSVTFARNNPLREARLKNFIESATTILLRPVIKRFRHVEWRKSSDIVENKYDLLSGNYINNKYYEGRDVQSLCYIDGKIRPASYIEKHDKMAEEYSQILSKFKFRRILEVGAGELTTLSSLGDYLEKNIEYYAMDLSLNRVYLGRNEFMKRYNRKIHVCKANAISLPYPDNYFDLVFTSHCLEHMPYDYQKAIDEMCRVTRKLVVLFEPSYELGDFSQKLRMIAKDYAKKIPDYIVSLKNVDMVQYYLLANGDLYNRTACHMLFVRKSEKEQLKVEDFNYVCPPCKSKLIKYKEYLRCEDCNCVYFLFEGIPLLDTEYSTYITFH